MKIVILDSYKVQKELTVIWPKMFTGIQVISVILIYATNKY